MKALKTVGLSALITFMMVLTAQRSDNQSSSHRFVNQAWLASQIYSTAFNDVSPGFDDLYVIKTQDKGREIVIYCNTTYCYKNRNSIMTT